MDRRERETLIDRYAEGPDRFEAAVRLVPPEAMQWRPGPGKWSVHEVIVHCGDSEMNSAMRIRYLIGEDKPVIQGYSQDHWAVALDYHSLPIEPALAAARAARLNTVPLLRRLTEAEWARTGTHTEDGSYGVAAWLRIYAEHLHQHERQVLRNLEAWQTGRRAAGQTGR